MDKEKNELNNKTRVFYNVDYLDPRYNFLERYIHIMYKGFWTPAKYEKLINEQKF